MILKKNGGEKNWFSNPHPCALDPCYGSAARSCSWQPHSFTAHHLNGACQTQAGTPGQLPPRLLDKCYHITVNHISTMVFQITGNLIVCAAVYSKETLKVCITGPLWGESTSHWWFPLTKAINAEMVSMFRHHETVLQLTPGHLSYEINLHYDTNMNFIYTIWKWWCHLPKMPNS